jgi:hypothetical protein
LFSRRPLVCQISRQAPIVSDLIIYELAIPNGKTHRLLQKTHRLM